MKFIVDNLKTVLCLNVKAKKPGIQNVLLSVYIRGISDKVLLASQVEYLK